MPRIEGKRFPLTELTEEESLFQQTVASFAHDSIRPHEIFGGYGYTLEYPISRFFVDARVQTIYAGTSEIMKEVIARSMLGK